MTTKAHVFLRISISELSAQPKGEICFSFTSNADCLPCTDLTMRQKVTKTPIYSFDFNVFLTHRFSRCCCCCPLEMINLPACFVPLVKMSIRKVKENKNEHRKQANIERSSEERRATHNHEIEQKVTPFGIYTRFINVAACLGSSTSTEIDTSKISCVE